jgi:methionine biosynthesis protein MetW
VAPRRLRRLLLEALEGARSCLDVGCGNGATTGLLLRERCPGYVGVDVSEEAVRAARGRGLAATRVSDASDLPFEDDSFDLAVCIEVLEHLFDPRAAVEEIARVVRPGGRVVVSVPNVAWWRSRADLALLGRWNPRGDDRSASEPWRDPHLRFFNRRGLAAMLADAGLEVERTGGHAELSLLGGVPVVRQLARSPEPGRVSELAYAVAPGLMANRLHAVARVVARP